MEHDMKFSTERGGGGVGEYLTSQSVKERRREGSRLLMLWYSMGEKERVASAISNSTWSARVKYTIISAVHSDSGLSTNSL